MMISNTGRVREPNFRKIYNSANEILVTTSTIEDFPFKAKALVREQSDIALCSFEKAKNKFQQNIHQFGSDSAVLMEMNGAHIIFYNESEQPYRIRFSIVHELGHYILGHKLNLSRNDPLYGIQEVEANCFAAQIIMPEQLLRQCTNRGKTISTDFIMNSFGVSDDAANKRNATLAKTIYEWRSREERQYDDIIIAKYERVLNRIAPIPRQQLYSFEDDYEMEQERNGWLDTRSHWH